MTYQGPPRNSKRKLFEALPSSKTPESREVRLGFDADRGQTFYESEVVFRSKNATHWITELRTPNITQKAKQPKIGVRSLLDVARSKCVTEMRDFTPEHFEIVPWSIANGIWEETVERHLESYYSWRLLASIYTSDAEFGAPEKRYFLALKQPPLPLTDYFYGLTSADRLWHVAIRISPKQTSTASDLVALSHITNLAALDLSDGQLLFDAHSCVFDGRIMRTWAELAASGRAFQELRVLMFGWQDNLSTWLFQYLNKFPILCYVVVTDCKDLHQRNRSDWEDIALDNGWRALHAKKSVKALRPFLDDGSFRLGNVSNLYYQSQTVLDVEQKGSSPSRAVRPLIECWIGTPRPWTHIIDEFPGTRTIWFERNIDGMHLVVSDAPKRNRENTKMSDAASSSSPPANRSQRRMKEASKRKITTDAQNMLAEIGFSSTKH